MPFSLSHLLLVGFGGALGSMCRYLVGAILMKTSLATLTAFPIATLLVNLVGSFLIGAFAAWSLESASAPQWLKPLIIAGFLGGFTTFSAFSLESLNLIGHHSWGRACFYVLVSVCGCILAAFLGMRLIKYYIG